MYFVRIAFWLTHGLLRCTERSLTIVLFITIQYLPNVEKHESIYYKIFITKTSRLHKLHHKRFVDVKQNFLVLEDCCDFFCLNVTNQSCLLRRATDYSNKIHLLLYCQRRAKLSSFLSDHRCNNQYCPKISLFYSSNILRHGKNKEFSEGFKYG